MVGRPYLHKPFNIDRHQVCLNCRTISKTGVAYLTVIYSTLTSSENVKHDCFLRGQNTDVPQNA